MSVGAIPFDPGAALPRFLRAQSSPGVLFYAAALTALVDAYRAFLGA